MTETLWRAIAIVDLALLLSCGTAIHLAYRTAIPRLAWLAGWGYGVVLAIVTLAIGVNAVLGEPLNPGQRIVTAGITVPALFIGVLVVCEVRRGWRAARDERRDRIITRADELAAWSAHVEHAAPCTNPQCQQMRADLLRITGPSQP